jgi:hypothetical protein
VSPTETTLAPPTAAPPRPSPLQITLHAAELADELGESTLTRREFQTYLDLRVRRLRRRGTLRSVA